MVYGSRHRDLPNLKIMTTAGIFLRFLQRLHLVGLVPVPLLHTGCMHVCMCNACVSGMKEQCTDGDTRAHKAELKTGSGFSSAV